jgi:hypothetical protein
VAGEIGHEAGDGVGYVWVTQGVTQLAPCRVREFERLHQPVIEERIFLKTTKLFICSCSYKIGDFFVVF